MQSVNPVHFFDNFGNHVGAVEELEKRCAALEEENENLRDQLRAAVQRLHYLFGELPGEDPDEKLLSEAE